MIAGMGVLISLIGDKLGPDRINHVLPILLERLGNEIIRLTAVKAFREILSSKQVIIILEQLARDLTALLRQLPWKTTGIHTYARPPSHPSFRTSLTHHFV